MKILSALFILISLSSQAGLPPTTLSGQSESTKPVTFNFKTPYDQSTPITGGGLIETGSENMLVNGNFEAPTLNGWTCTTGTCTVESTIFSSGKQSAKIVPTANIFDFSQQVNTPANIQKQGVMGIIYNFPATCTTASIQTIIDGTAQTTVPTASLILDGAFHSIEVPTFFGATSAKLRAFSTATCTGNIYLDKAYVSQGIGFQSLQLDNVYSAQVSSAGVISGENKDWINGNCTLGGVNNAEKTCTFVTGIFTVAPNCVTVQSTTDDLTPTLATTSTTVTLRTANAGTGAAGANSFICQKAGVDYLSSSSNIYAISTTSILALATDFSWQVSNTGVVSGENLDVVNANCTNANPSVCTFNSSIFTVAPNCTVTSANTANNLAITTPVTSTSTTVTIQQNSSLVATQEAFSVHCQKSGVDYTNAIHPFIVGSFAGYTNVPGYTGLIDTFSVSYGTTNATTVCSASPCSYLDQIGAAVSSITRASTGVYSLNTSRTYTKLKCQTGIGGTMSNSVLVSAINCLNCSTAAFNSLNTSFAAADSFGTLSCQGTY
jgi:hypothetical protein